MARLALISAAALAVNGTFFRLGRKWTTEGTVVDVSEFNEAEWTILTSEKMLHIGPAPDGATVAAQDATTLREALKASIAQLEAGDFEADGKPKLGALKERHPAQAKQVTAKLVAEIWAELAPPA